MTSGPTDGTGVVGVIGLGAMGGNMAERLLERGWSVIAFDTDPAKRKVLERAGARIAQDARDVADHAPVVLCSLPTPDALEAASLGSRGIAGGAAVTTLIEVSTSGPAVLSSVSAALAAHGVLVADAPITGSPATARAGALTFMVAGCDDALASADPVLASLANSVVRVGETVGQGQVMKLINNVLSATALAATAEALLVGAKEGLDPAVMLSVLNQGSGRNSATYDKVPNDVLTRNFAHGFAISHIHKDVRLFAEQASTLGVPADLARRLLQIWGQAEDARGAGADCTEIFRYFEDAAGIELR